MATGEPPCACNGLLLVLGDQSSTNSHIVDALLTPFSREVVAISMREGLKALGQRQPESDGCRRYAVGNDGKHHPIKMMYCDNDECETAIPRVPDHSYSIVELTTGTEVGVRLHGVAPSLKLRLCAACKNAQYCCKACQKHHWKEHRLVCETLRERLVLDKAEAQASAPEVGAVVRLGRDWRGMKNCSGLRQASVLAITMP